MLYTCLLDFSFPQITVGQAGATSSPLLFFFVGDATKELHYLEDHVDRLRKFTMTP